MFINSNASAFVQHNLATKPPEGDESKFILKDELSIDALKDSGEATIVFQSQSPSEAWDIYVNSTLGSMIEVSSTIPTAFNDVTTRLASIFEENNITPFAELSIKHAIPESKDAADSEELKTAEFIVKGVGNEEIKEQIEEVLNSDNYADFKNYFLALDKLTASENTSIANARDSLLGNNTANNINTGSMASYGYEQDFSLKYLEGNWKMDTSLEKVELLRISKLDIKW
jgi:hypothetical protein